MAKPNFRAVKDGEGRIRFFVDGGEHTLEEYTTKYVKYHGTMPEIPVGLGGRAADEPKAETPDLQKQVDELKAKIVELEVKNAMVTKTVTGDIIGQIMHLKEEQSTPTEDTKEVTDAASATDPVL